MSLPLLLFSIDVAAVACIALFGALVIRQRPHLLAAQIVALISFDAICNVVLAHYEYGPWMPQAYRIMLSPGLAVFLNLARNFTPAAFMVLCYVLFTDKRSFPSWLIALVFIQMFLEEPVRILIPTGWRYMEVATQVAPALLQAFFVGVALYWTVVDWRFDLIETRRRTRALVQIFIGIDVLVSGLFLRLIVDPNSPVNYATHVTLTACDLSIAVFLLFQFSGGRMDVYLDPLRQQPSVLPPSVHDPEDDAALARLLALMENDHLYRNTALSLRSLADKVGLPEYRLRRLIHERLGFANFNAFLHAWRVREACGQLRDPALRRTPILTIALSVGYQSVNTFNRGFRDVVDMTPSAYRALDDAPIPPKPEIRTPKTA